MFAELKRTFVGFIRGNPQRKRKREKEAVVESLPTDFSSEYIRFELEEPAMKKAREEEEGSSGGDRGVYAPTAKTVEQEEEEEDDMLLLSAPPTTACAQADPPSSPLLPNLDKLVLTPVKSLYSNFKRLYYLDQQHQQEGADAGGTPGIPSRPNPFFTLDKPFEDTYVPTEDETASSPPSSSNSQRRTHQEKYASTWRTSGASTRHTLSSPDDGASSNPPPSLSLFTLPETPAPNVQHAHKRTASSASFFRPAFQAPSSSSSTSRSRTPQPRRTSTSIAKAVHSPLSFTSPIIFSPSSSASSSRRRSSSSSTGLTTPYSPSSQFSSPPERLLDKTQRLEQSLLFEERLKAECNSFPRMFAGFPPPSRNKLQNPFDIPDEGDEEEMHHSYSIARARERQKTSKHQKWLAARQAMKPVMIPASGHKLPGFRPIVKTKPTSLKEDFGLLSLFDEGDDYYSPRRTTREENYEVELYEELSEEEEEEEEKEATEQERERIVDYDSLFEEEHPFDPLWLTSAVSGEEEVEEDEDEEKGREGTISLKDNDMDAIEQRTSRFYQQTLGPIEWKKTFYEEQQAARVAQVKEILERRQKWLETFRTAREQLEKEKTLRQRLRELEERRQVRALTEDEKMVVKYALARGPQSEVLVSGFNCEITRGDISHLQPTEWLNDEVINFYLNLLAERAKEFGSAFPKCHFFNTFFYPLLTDRGGYNYARVSKWTRRVDLFEMEKVIVPIHLGNHWCLAVINFNDRRFEYYDSLGSRNDICIKKLRRYLNDESLDKRLQEIDLSDWTDYQPKDIPQQRNGHDCGVFMCRFAESISSNHAFDFSQKDMPYFRRRMIVDILQKSFTQ